MVHDTAWALETYAAEVDRLDDDKPNAYIRIFGVLNGLVIQQDAAFLLFEALGAPKVALEFAKPYCTCLKRCRRNSCRRIRTDTWTSFSA